MATSFVDFFRNFREIPVSRKIATFSILFLVVTGVGSIFLWANKSEQKVLFNNLAPEDSAEIVTKLKELKIPYTLERNESVILVPDNRIHDARLGLAEAGLPKSGIGFEIFDKTDFGTTEFVQQLNFQRALQGELARTIKEMDEVKDCRVIVVMPKDSVFVEDVKPPSASVFLKLRSKLQPGKVEAIVHLVASAVEDLTPELVTVVDSDGKVLSRGNGVDESDAQLNKQFEYKLAYEKNMAGRVQTMLEEIVGPGKAIVRVTADMDFAQVDVNEELFDPDTQVVRSRQTIADQNNKNDTVPNRISSVNPIGNENGPMNRTEANQHNDETVNYEISKTVRVTQNPVGTVLKLSVAAVLDGNYEWQKDDKGISRRVYVARSAEELTRFETIVKQAMGYSADREDQVSVESIPFSSGEIWGKEPEQAGLGFQWANFRSDYGQPVANIAMIMLLFLFVVRPLVKTFKQVSTEGDDHLLEDKGVEQLIFDDQGRPMLPKPRATTIQEKAMNLAREDINRAANIIKGWLSEGED